MYKEELVESPQHYISNGLEAIDVVEKFELDFHLGNAVTYILRAGKKTECPIMDIEKAIWYLNRFLKNKKDE